MVYIKWVHRVGRLVWPASCGCKRWGLVLLMIWAGCSSPPQARLVHAVAAGRHGEVRSYLQEHQITDRRSRKYLLDRMRLALVTLADGYAGAAVATFEEIFDVLRTAGINADKTIASVVVNEDIKFWKGEPFEQAMAYIYVGLHHTIRGQWSNLRAAADNALFHVRDFGTDENGRLLDNEQIVYRSLQKLPNDDRIENYQVRASGFSLGYLLSAIANQQLGRSNEANEQLDQVLANRPDQYDLVELLRSGHYNTVIVVDYGQGPEKIGVGPDRAIARFEPVMPSTSAPLVVTIGGQRQEYMHMLDLNETASDHRWNNLEDMRLAKSYLGTIMMAGGAATAG